MSTTTMNLSAGGRLRTAGAVLVLAGGGVSALVAARAPAAPRASSAVPAGRSASRTPAAPPAARQARVLSIDDTGKLHLLKASGAILQEEGPGTGTLAANIKVRLVVHATITATFTIEARGGGSIAGRAAATLHSSRRYSSFGGSLSVEHGTGRYAHAHGSWTLYGVIDRRTHALTVQTVGQLHY
jgi:hypothetical protein